MSDGGIVEHVARQIGLDEKRVEHVIEAFCRQLHKRQYEYDGGNGNYICEKLSFELSDFAWIHLYQFLTLHAMRLSGKYPEDVWADSTEQLSYMGGSPRWQKYFHECETWKMSSKYGIDRSLY